MSLTEEPYYLKRDCSPMCNHQEECVRCHNPHCIKYMYHSRLHGYTCTCGSQEWKPVLDLPKQGSGLTQDAAELAKRAAHGVGLQAETSCKNCGHSKSRHLTAGGFCKHCPCNEFVESTMPPIR